MEETEKLSDLISLLKVTGRRMNGAGELVEFGKKVPVIRQGTHDWWLVTLEYQGRSYVFDFWDGAGMPRFMFQYDENQWWEARRRKPPELDVRSAVSCIVSDAQVGAYTFEDFCSSFGYSDDSIKALRIWEACVQVRRELQTLLGRDFERFMTTENDI